MTVNSVTLNPVSDTYLTELTPTFNFGSNTYIAAGINAGKFINMLLRFDIPKYTGKIKSIKLRLYLFSLIGVSQTAIVYVVDSPYDDLWIEGTSNGAVDAKGCSWNEYVKNADWPTPGGDFDDKPIGIKIILSTDPTGQYYEIDIPIDNFAPKSESSISLLIKSPDISIIGSLVVEGRTLTHPPELVIEVDIDGFNTPTFSANPISSTQIDLSWPKSQLADDNFTHYLLEQSDTGVGGWTTLATITDKDTTSYQHTGIVVQGNVDDFDEDLDTYPNGRIKYYRMSILTNGFGYTPTSSIVYATTIPAIRPVKLSFAPKSKYWNENFVDDNRAYKPYGVQVIPSWYDLADITEEGYIDKLSIETFFRQAASWPGAASTTDDFTPVNFVNGEIIEGDTGYKPYKIKGKIFDTGGLYRKCTIDKVAEQFDVVFPAPCPIAIPSGDFADAPPALSGRPFSAGSLVPIDLSFCGQQIGENIFVEDFIGLVSNKWNSRTLGTASVTYQPDSIRLELGNTTPASMSIWKKFKKELDNSYNKYFDKYTGGYKLKILGKFSNVTYTNNLICIFTTHGWKMNTTDNRGVQLSFQTTTNTISVDAWPNIGAATRNLLTKAIAAASNPLNTINSANYFYLEIIASPYFGIASEGMLYVFIWNIAATKTLAENINLATIPDDQFLIAIDTGMTGTEQIHYTGTSNVQFETTSNQNTAKLDLYKYIIEGRINGQQYSCKNLTHNQTLGLTSSPIPLLPITCSPELISELCYIEGRIKNQYGAQSRTGEVDDYQGDTFNNAVPIGFLSVAKVGFIGSDVFIDASQSIDPEGGDLIYHYDFGDGSTDDTTSQNISHTYSTTGVKTIKLIVEDEAGQMSVEVQALITICDAIEQFDEVTLMSPWTSISQNSPTGTSKTELPEVDYDVIQTMPGGNRVFSITGIHSSPDCTITEAQRMALAEAEKELFQWLKNHGNLISLDLEYFGLVKGVIIEHNPSMGVEDQSAFGFSLTFQEVSTEQFGE